MMTEPHLFRRQGIRAIAIVSVYAPIDFTLRQEELVRDLIKERLPDVDITLQDGRSHWHPRARERFDSQRRSPSLRSPHSQRLQACS